MSIEQIYRKFEDGIEKTVISILQKKGEGRTIRDLAIIFDYTPLASELKEESPESNPEIYLGMALGKMKNKGKIINENEVWYVNGEYHG